mmetsp:Transcript_11330/g.12452  ORF Transcript_11330/g.12452 Transcript_11330/m.12452 type:complete len:535 (-) Transcript_11330:144-1748(-)
MSDRTEELISNSKYLIDILDSFRIPNKSVPTFRRNVTIKEINHEVNLNVPQMATYFGNLPLLKNILELEIFDFNKCYELSNTFERTGFGLTFTVRDVFELSCLTKQYLTITYLKNYLDIINLYNDVLAYNLLKVILYAENVRALQLLEKDFKWKDILHVGIWRETLLSNKQRSFRYLLQSYRSTITDDDLYGLYMLALRSGYLDIVKLFHRHRVCPSLTQINENGAVRFVQNVFRSGNAKIMTIVADKYYHLVNQTLSVPGTLTPSLVTNLQTAKFLIKTFPNFYDFLHDEKVLLYLRKHLKRPKLARFIIEQTGYDVGFLDESDCNLFIYACKRVRRCRKRSLLKYLLENYKECIDINHAIHHQKNTALHYVCYHESLDVVDMIFHHFPNCDVDKKNSIEWTPLTYLLLSNDFKNIRMMIERFRADVLVEDSFGKGLDQLAIDAQCGDSLVKFLQELIWERKLWKERRAAVWTHRKRLGIWGHLPFQMSKYIIQQYLRPKGVKYTYPTDEDEVEDEEADDVEGEEEEEKKREE